MPSVVPRVSPRSSWSVASMSTARVMVSFGAPAKRRASVRDPDWPPPPPAERAVSDLVIVSGLYWKTITLASGLYGSIPTIAPLIKRGVPLKLIVEQAPRTGHLAAMPGVDRFDRSPRGS